MADSFVWTILNMDPAVSNSDIMGWISEAGIPTCFKFRFDTPFDNMWKYHDDMYGKIPMPLSPYTITVSPVKDSRFEWKIARGMAVQGFHQVAVASRLPGDSGKELGARIWHEILHCYQTESGNYIPADDMNSTEKDAFLEYLLKNNSIHYNGFWTRGIEYDTGANHAPLLCEYYTYLTKKHLNCSCFHEGCWEQPSVTQNVLYQQSYTPTIVTNQSGLEYEPIITNQTPSQEDYGVVENNNNNMYLIGGAVLLFLLLR
jgi:hypothetical protein